MSSSAKPPSRNPDPTHTLRNTVQQILTPRLRLLPMTPEFLRALIAKHPEEAAGIAGFTVPKELTVPHWVLELRLRMVEKDPELIPWLLRSVVERESNAMVGDIGFHGPPGLPHLQKYSTHGLEMGYSIQAAHRRRGYAREAVQGMMTWARDHHGVNEFVLSINPSNEPSLRMAAVMGFQKVGSQLDEIDGVEEVFLLRMTAQILDPENVGG